MDEKTMLINCDDTEIQVEEDLTGPGAKPGTVPTDLEQSTGLERLEILGKMEGVDVFDMRPLDASRKGTIENPIPVRSAGEEQYLGCTGVPVDSHVTIWLTVRAFPEPAQSVEDYRDLTKHLTDLPRPPHRALPECGSVYKMEYVGPTDDHHHDHHHGHGYEEPKTFADFVKPEYRYQ
ncbi:cytochrome C oxidase subunit VB [Colletotrichum tofieldiae]|nr:cytochrome C oxidase subunit VB [Colletotrichum tofieldiae]